jgi:hypothetical protein
MATDVGYILFVQLLGMTQYPGSPFTGNIYRDLIMFLVVPTIFIIMVLYVMTGRIIPDRKMRIMLGVGAFLFIIASGYYSVFALLAGPYFIFLIFILGILKYLLDHFRSHDRGSSGAPTFSSSGSYSEGSSKFKSGLFRRPKMLGRQPLEDEYMSVLETLAYNKGRQNKGDEVKELMFEKTRLEIELFGHKLNNGEIKKKYGIDLG